MHSNLVSYVKLSPNYSKRNHKIDTITIHHMAGNLSLETCGNIFASKSRKASSNYGIDSNGKIACYVEEENRAWTSSNRANDMRAITIEVANIKGEPNWEVSDVAIESLINLLVDVCKRNGIPALLWQNDKTLIGKIDKQNMTVHRWFAATKCCGDYLLGKHYYIAEEVNKRLGVNPSNSMKVPFLVKVNTNVLNIRPQAGTSYRVCGTVLRNEVFTITAVEKVQTGFGTTMTWGKLKSGRGWICLDYCIRL